MNRGDVVIIDFPCSDRTGSKVRPSLVVQSDTLNPIRHDAILAIIPSMWSGRPGTEILVEVTNEPGSGLRFDSYLQCDTLVTLDQSLVLGVIGSLSAQIVPGTRYLSRGQRMKCLPSGLPRRRAVAGGVRGLDFRSRRARVIARGPGVQMWLVCSGCGCTRRRNCRGGRCPPKGASSACTCSRSL
jgi:mRNA interferase MazF